MKRQILTSAGWINIKKSKPTQGSRVLVCDENGYVCIEEVDSDEFEAIWEYGNSTKLVAWMQLPGFPHVLCNDDADGEP